MRITNAVDAQPYEWPWFVLISKRGKSGAWRHVCGASLIDEIHADSASKLTLSIKYLRPFIDKTIFELFG